MTVSTDTIYRTSDQPQPQMLKGKSPRRRIFENGFTAVVVSGKSPAVTGLGWNSGEFTEARLKADTKAYPEATNTGVICGRPSATADAFIPFDVDLHDPAHAEAIKQVVFGICGPTPAVRVGSKGFALCYRCPAEWKKLTIAAADGEKVEILGSGGQMVVHGTHPTPGVGDYRWIGDFDPACNRLDELPVVSEEKLRQAADAILSKMTQLGYPKVRRTGVYQAPAEDGQLRRVVVGKPVSSGDLLRLLSHIDPEKPRDDWYPIVGAIRNTPGDHEPEELRDIAHAWSEGRLMFDGRYDGGPPASWSKESDRGLCCEAAVDRVFDSMPPKTQAEGGSGIWTIIAVSNRERRARGLQRFAAYFTANGVEIDDDDGADEDEDADFDGAAAEEGEAPAGEVAATQAKPPGFFGDPHAETLVPPWPLEGLPATVRNLVERKSESTGCDPAAIALSALVVASGVLNRRARIRMKRRDSYEQYPHLWGLKVGDVSYGKGPAMGAAVAPLRKLDGENAGRQATHDRLTAAARKHAAAEAKTGAVKVGEVEDFVEPEEPEKLPVHVFHDITKEALYEELAESDCGKIGVFPEMSSWVGQMDQYSGKANSMSERGLWCSVFDGGRLPPQRRKGAGRSKGGEAGASLLAGVQLPLLRLSGNLTADGLLQRCLIVMMQPRGPEQDVDCQGVDHAWEQLVRRLAALPPMNLHFTEEGYDIRACLADDLRVLGAQRSLNTHLRGHLGKLEQYFGRLCLVLHVLDLAGGQRDLTRPEVLVVSTAIAKYVDQLIRGFFLPHAVAFFDALAGGAEEELLQRLASFILTDRHMRYTPSAFVAGVPALRHLSGKEHRRELHNLADRLVLMRWLRPVWPDPERPGLGIIKAYEVHPALRTTLAARAAQLAAEKETITAQLNQWRPVASNQAADPAEWTV